MRPIVGVLSFLAVMGLAFWAYHENYATQQALKDVSKLNREIAGLRDALAIQRAEWAYLNRPDRLRELSTINFDALGLLPLEPGQFGQAAQVVFPAPEMPVEILPEINAPVDVSGDQEPFP